jgi:hypothetical protein
MPPYRGIHSVDGTYSALFPLVGGGGETVAPAVLQVTGPAAIVDWILLELRSKDNPATVLASRAALLRRDGLVVDVDGTSPVAVPLPVGDYYVAIQHRNHLGAMARPRRANYDASLLTHLPATATWERRPVQHQRQCALVR